MMGIGGELWEMVVDCVKLVIMMEKYGKLLRIMGNGGGLCEIVGTNGEFFSSFLYIFLHTIYIKTKQLLM